MLRLKTWLKWAIILITVTFAGFWIWAQFFMEDWLRQVVKKEIATLAEKHYNCSYDTLLINTYFFHFELRNLSLSYDRRFAVPVNDPYLITGKARLLKLRRFSVIDLIFLRKISMRTFEFDSPQI
ncbi:MAG: hypothetical protein ABIV51_09710, partial [Saprospiraceae bacterium]